MSDQGALPKDLRSVEAVAQIAARLRAEDGCPWDRGQTHASLRTQLIEEAYEVLAAIDSNSDESLREELGDLLFHIVIHSQIASEAGAFDLSDVARSVNEKLIRRHPHVFEGKEIQGNVLSQWEAIKREENSSKGEDSKSLLSGVSRTLPALFAAERMLERVARVGIKPDRVDLPLDVDDNTMLGDLLFDLVALARENEMDAETALREANLRFAARVARLEDRARAAARDLDSYDRAELGALWEESA